MAWSEQWSYKIDGTELNDRTNFFCQVPELDQMPEQDAILRDVAGDYPSFIRLQPREANYTFLIAMTNCNWATYQTRLATLKSIFSPGVHTFTVQARGMTAAKSMSVIVKGGMTQQPKERLVSIVVVAPKPVFV